MNINFEYYKVFYFVTKSGSFTAAAKELCISQPAVSQAVKQLETAMGCSLFVRTPKGIDLTGPGTALFSYVERGIDCLFDGERTVSRMMNLDIGEVKIGASDMTLQFYLLPYLEKFHEKYPNIKVTVSNAPTPETIESLYEGKIDFGVVSSPFEVSPEIRSIPVKDISNIFVAGSKFADLKGQELSYECLKHQPCIFLDKRTSTRKFMDDYLMDNGIVLEPEFELATSDMIVQFAKRNLGIGCVMSEFAAEKLAAEELFELKFKKEMPRRSICVVTSGVKDFISISGHCLLDMLLDEPAAGSSSQT